MGAPRFQHLKRCTLYPRYRGRPRRRALHHQLLLPSGGGLPENIRSLPAGGDSFRSTGQSIHLKLLPVELSEQGIPTFKFETLGEAPADGLWSPLEPEEASLECRHPPD